MLAATGGSERHSLMPVYAMRPLFASLGAAAMPTAVYATSVELEGGDTDLTGRINRAASELARALDDMTPEALPVPLSLGA